MSTMNLIAGLADKTRSLHLLVLGDLILDRYTWGDAERVSPEAPVLVLRANQCEVRLGGAASVASLLRGLGANVVLAGVLGDDADGRVLRRLLEESGIDTRFVLTDSHRPTTTKERFLGLAAHRHPQQILRVDHELRQPIPGELEERLAAATVSAAEFRVVLVSDYAKGVCTPRLLAALIAAAHRKKLPLIVDPARMPDYGLYRGVQIIVPNRTEAELATGMQIHSPADALRAGRQLCDEYGLAAALVKLDSDGIAVVDRRAGIEQHVPTRPRAVYDVTGAGDMVLAIVGLCQAAGWGLVESAELANVAAGLEVEKLGVAPVSWGEIRAELQRGKSTSKLVTLDEMAKLAAAYRHDGKAVVFTNGCFDLLHVGHVTYLQEAAQLGDALIVAINSDASVQRLKGPQRPIIHDADRAGLLAALACVDHVLIFDDDTPHRLLERIRPDVLVKGGTYTPDEVVGAEVVRAYGGRIYVTQKVEATSTSAIMDTIRERSSRTDQVARRPLAGRVRFVLHRNRHITQRAACVPHARTQELSES